MANVVLVVIDMQRIFADPSSEWATPGFANIVPRIEELVAAYDNRKVIFTRFVVPPNPTDAWCDYYRAWPFALQLAAENPSIYDLISPFGDRPTIDVSTFSKWGAELAEAVKPGGTLILAGVSTDCCVLSTALAAVDAGMHVRVVADATAGPSHRDALEIMKLYGPQLQIIETKDALE
jgi:nicotinamidase-related amidase